MLFNIRRCQSASTAIVLVSMLLLRNTTSFSANFAKHGNRLLSELNSKPTGEDQIASRRDFLSTAIALPLAASAFLSSPLEAVAAGPMTTGEAEGLGARAERALRPKPPRALRPKLSQDFAVLLMRSSYNSLDQIDCVAMDQFQRDFFLIRQAEYEPYVEILGPGVVQQGMLSDPFYFDFISFAQYATIAREISQDPSLIFEEKQPIDMGEDKPMKFVPTVVRRDPSLSNDKLPIKHNELVGIAILDRLEEKFGETESAIPKIQRNSRPGSGIVLSALTQMVKLFLVNGFAFGGTVEIVGGGKPLVGADASGTEFCITMTLPANLWSGKALQLRRTVVTNDFVLKTAKELLRRAGYTVSKTSVKYEGNDEKTFFTIL
mmetsp:Transcript_12505/g.17755  ORF Transcript_12505/g.17755 Transcript_12505/m.17755 type:complete len:377 (-) Transcript_12505:362-1492(-)